MDIQALIPWLINHGYLIYFLISVVEGPVVAIAAGVVSAMGKFDLSVAIIIACLGDVVGDFLFYGIGYFSHNFMRWRIFRSMFTQKNIDKIEKLLLDHTAKVVVVIKLTPAIGIPGLIMLGSTHPSFKKFFRTAISITVPKSAFLVLCGYWSGQAYYKLELLMAQGERIVLAAIIGLILYLIYTKIVKLIVKKFDK